MLARALELPTVSSEVRRFQDQVAIVIERYDRTVERQVVRIIRRISVKPSQCRQVASTKMKVGRSSSRSRALA